MNWCKENNVNIKTYYYWLCRLRKQEIITHELPVTVKTAEKEIMLKRLEVQSPVANTNTQAAVTIRLSSAVIEVTEGTSQVTIEAVLSALHCLC